MEILSGSRGFELRRLRALRFGRRLRPGEPERPFGGTAGYRESPVQIHQTLLPHVPDPEAFVRNVECLAEVVPQVLARREWAELRPNGVDHAHEGHRFSARSQPPCCFERNHTTKRPTDHPVRRIHGQLIEDGEHVIDPIVDAARECAGIRLRWKHREDRTISQSLRQGLVVHHVRVPGVHRDQRCLIAVTNPTPSVATRRI